MAPRTATPARRCPPPRLWCPLQTLPLAQATPSEEYNPTSSSYWKSSVLKFIVPSMVFAGITVAMLLGLTTWRLVRCCCVRSKRRRRTKAAVEVLTGKVALAIKLSAVLLMGGVVAGAALGINAVNPSLVSNGWAAFNTAEDYIRSSVITANATVAVVQVRWLPAGRPVGPCGGVGHFHCHACRGPTHCVFLSLSSCLRAATSRSGTPSQALGHGGLPPRRPGFPLGKVP